MKPLILPLIIFLGSLYGLYYTLEEKRQYEADQAKRLATQQKNIETSALADEKEFLLAEKKEELAQAKEVRVNAENDLDLAQKKENTLRDTIAKREAALAGYKEQQKKFEDTKAEVEQLAGELGMDFTIDNIEQHLARMKETKTQRVERVEELDLLITEAEESIEENTAELARQVAREEARQLKIDRGAIEAVITGVQQDWGFLVIGAGEKQGFTPTSTLLVMRDGRMIGKVRPSSIEPSQTIAEIIFPSLAPGVQLQPGDTVIFDDPAVD
ncbi:MAG: hypothetical protein R3242_08070 [Akkermansiaceae bacterium]|nr:hypothetical protein [Akkermansiaceae bacterium]